MKVLAITLHTFEADYERCLDGIRRQTHQQLEHICFHDLPSTQANQVLYQTFMDRADKYDLFIRVDADMVITDPTLVEQVVERMAGAPEYDILTLYIDDFFTGRLISGLHTYRTNVRWKVDDPVNPERHDIPPHRILIDRDGLGRAVLHGHGASPLEALQFGIHRGVKLRSWLIRRRRDKVFSFARVVDRLWQNFKRKRDRRVALAVLGAELGLRGVFGPQHLSHQEPLPAQLLATLEHHDDQALAREAARLRRQAWGWLPTPGRQRALWWWGCPQGQWPVTLAPAPAAFDAPGRIS